jgi:prepilin-type processing-associated H-X9-DG protein
VYPSQTYAFGDTYDTPRQTCGIGFSLCTYNGTTTSGLRHGTQWNYAFCDGHAKSVKVKGGYLTGAENGRMAMPASTEIAMYAYCADPTAIINMNTTGSSDSMPIPSGIACGAIPALLNTFPTCPTTGGTNCWWPN